MGFLDFLKDVAGTHIDDNGEEVLIFEDGVKMKKLHSEYHLYSGEQWCPNCKIKMHLEGDRFVCPTCGHDITVQEAEDGYGYSSLEAINEEDYGYSNVYVDEYMDSDDWEDL